MGTTPNGYPYPEDTDPVAAGAQAIKALASAVDTKSSPGAAGVAQIPITAASNGSLTVTLPAGRFTSAPAIVGTPEDSTYLCACYARSSTSFSIRLRSYDNTSATATKPTSWIARTPG